MIEPMLAAKAKPKRLKELMEDPEWVGELKLDGCRYIAEFRKDGIHFTSRRTSVVTGEPVDKSENIPHLSKHTSESKALIGTVLDGEISCAALAKRSNDVTRIMGASPDKAIARQVAEGWLVYRVFDVLFITGHDVQADPYTRRRAKMVHTLKRWNNEHAVKVTKNPDKTALLQEAWSLGMEGIILKKLDAPYIQGARDADIWVKMKQSMDFDAIIMGFEDPDEFSYRKHPDSPKDEKVVLKGIGARYKTVNRNYARGWIKSIIYGAYDDSGKVVRVGTCSGMDDEMRERLSKNRKKFIGQVFEFGGQVFQEDGVRHPRFTRLRDDKDAKDCTLSELKNAPKESIRYE